MQGRSLSEGLFRLNCYKPFNVCQAQQSIRLSQLIQHMQILLARQAFSLLFIPLSPSPLLQDISEKGKI